MTAELASTFATVFALDVSDDQIKLARELLGPRGANVTFLQVTEPVMPIPSRTCSAMFSCHVFQHFPDFRGVARYLAETFRVLRSGGTACFHIPIDGAHRSSSASPLRLVLHNIAVSVRRAAGILNIMEYHRYSATQIFRALQAIGFRDAELRVFDMASNGDAHSFFFARRP